MEEEKKEKKSLLGNKSIIIIAIAVVLIVAGTVLILTGNSKNLVSADKKENKTQDETQKPEDDPKRAIQKGLTDDEAFNILVKEKEEKLLDEPWSIGSVDVLAHGDNNTYLVQYEQVETEGFSKQLLTIITVEEANSVVKQLPGWVEGEVDITSYNFDYYSTEPVQEQATPEPVNPTTTPDEEDTTELPGEVDNEPVNQPAEQPVDQPEEPVEQPTEVEPVVPAENE